MQEERPQVAPEDEMDLSQDMSTLAAKMIKVLKSMTADGDVDPEESNLAMEALFFLKCWEEAATHADDPEGVLGMSKPALQASTMFIVNNVLNDPDFKGQTTQALLAYLFIMGVFTGIEYQERKHA